MEEKSYYELQLEKLNDIDDLQEKREFLESIDYSNKIEKEGDAAIIKELQIFLEGIKERIIVEKEITKEIISWQNKSDLAEQIWKIKPYFYDKSGLWWLWNHQKFKWEKVDDEDILIMVKNNSRANTVSSKEKGEIIESMKQHGRQKIPKQINKTWVQFKDKVYDVSYGEVFMASPEYFVTNPIPYEVSGNPSTPNIDRIFKEWVGEDFSKTLFEIIAYCLIPDYPIHRLFCFIGSGLNGKSCFLRLLKKFLGEENVTATELDVLLNSRFEITRLYKKLVCIMGETNFSELSKTSIIKKLTGQDLIGFEYKNKTPFEDTNYSKIIIATNNLPTTTDKTIGFYRRWLIIDFPNQFSEKKDILSEIPEEEYSNLATECVCRLNELLTKKEFNNEGTIEERTKRYEDKSNFFDKFWEESIKIDYDSYITVKEFERRLQEFCRNNHQRMLSFRSISDKMKEKGIEQGRPFMNWFENDKEIKKQVRAWEGIKWN